MKNYELYCDLIKNGDFTYQYLRLNIDKNPLELFEYGNVHNEGRVVYFVLSQETGLPYLKFDLDTGACITKDGGNSIHRDVANYVSKREQAKLFTLFANDIIKISTNNDEIENKCNDKYKKKYDKLLKDWEELIEYVSSECERTQHPLVSGILSKMTSLERDNVDEIYKLYELWYATKNM